ncbi:tyrosine-type recombinase/integrase [Paraburkholderia susongensis]|uniref:tyrosine-type recombinase/integrase n=1 Tax=Paraburkholderia susongensis TaxID=1515439 RepID=UPI001FC9287B|nr:tyrosine-type recombinase/integrase [Paraburkholderia susongensis]
MRFAVATGMRRGEIVTLRWEYVNLDRRTAYLPVTKTDTPRTVPPQRGRSGPIGP